MATVCRAQEAISSSNLSLHTYTVRNFPRLTIRPDKECSNGLSLPGFEVAPHLATFTFQGRLQEDVLH